MYIEIEEKSGFCFGVARAVEKAEQQLRTDNTLYCLGEIVHNQVEVNRLREIGLKTIDHHELKKLSNCKVLIRAHGEPPETYRTAKENNIELIDATCPVVLKLQRKIKTACEENIANECQVVIYGKEGHAEVNGLVGQTSGKAIVVRNIEDLKKIDYSKIIYLHSQTTMSKQGFEQIRKLISEKITEKGFHPETNLKINDSVCGRVSNRDITLAAFADRFDLVIFVSGKNSSNGRQLYNVCKERNVNSYFISDVDEINREWFMNVQSAGISGATSTPSWLLHKVKDHIQKITA